MSEETGSAWTPQFAADLNSISGAAFQQLLSDFKTWSDSEPLGPLPPEVQNGWCNLTPRIAEALLRRNKQNRKVSLETVRKYARIMLAGEWRKTGQPGLLSEGAAVSLAIFPVLLLVVIIQLLYIRRVETT